MTGARTLPRPFTAGSSELEERGDRGRHPLPSLHRRQLDDDQTAHHTGAGLRDQLTGSGQGACGRGGSADSIHTAGEET